VSASSKLGRGLHHRAPQEEDLKVVQGRTDTADGTGGDTERDIGGGEPKKEVTLLVYIKRLERPEIVGSDVTRTQSGRELDSKSTEAKGKNDMEGAIGAGQTAQVLPVGEVSKWWKEKRWYLSCLWKWRQQKQEVALDQKPY